MAISDEYLNDAPTRAKGDPQFTRRVSRIITPGTLIDEHFMDPWQSNYLSSIHVDVELVDQKTSIEKSSRPLGDSMLNSPRTKVGVAWIDLASGDFFTQSSDILSLPSVIARIKPREIVLDESLKSAEHAQLMSILREDGNIITFQDASGNALNVSEWTPMLEDAIEDRAATAYTSNELAAASSLLQYVKHQVFDSRLRLRAPIRHQAEDHMIIDKNSLRALEIRSTIRDGSFEGSLLHSLQKTATKSGTRLLVQRMCE